MKITIYAADIKLAISDYVASRFRVRIQPEDISLAGWAGQVEASMNIERPDDNQLIVRKD